MTSKEILSLGKKTFQGWQDDNVSRLAAALAYYTLLSLAPLMVVLVSVAGLVFGQQAARGQLTDQLRDLVGPTAGESIQSLLAHAQSPTSGFLGTVLGVGALLFGASGVFGELQDAMNTIWGVAPKPGRGLLGLIKDRFFSFAMVFGVAFLLLVSLVLSTVLTALGHFFTRALPGGKILWQLVNVVVSLGMVTVLFGLVYKVVPDIKIAWRDVWVGGLATALLFTLGKFLLGLYLGTSTMTSPYGAAGSIVLLVVWVYYSAQILFLGAEFTRVYATRHGSHIEPSKDAIFLTTEARAEQGLEPRQNLTPNLS